MPSLMEIRLIVDPTTTSTITFNRDHSDSWKLERLYHKQVTESSIVDSDLKFTLYIWWLVNTFLGPELLLLRTFTPFLLNSLNDTHPPVID
jgi:hypothetical protein